MTYSANLRLEENQNNKKSSNYLLESVPLLLTKLNEPANYKKNLKF